MAVAVAVAVGSPHRPGPANSWEEAGSPRTWKRESPPKWGSTQVSLGTVVWRPQAWVLIAHQGS